MEQTWSWILTWRAPLQNWCVVSPNCSARESPANLSKEKLKSYHDMILWEAGILCGHCFKELFHTISLGGVCNVINRVPFCSWYPGLLLEPFWKFEYQLYFRSPFPFTSFGAPIYVRSSSTMTSLAVVQSFLAHLHPGFQACFELVPPLKVLSVSQ